jgi:aspartate kinase
MLVLKFGGTSVKDANAMNRVLDIISKSQETQLVVLSACSGITDKLLTLPHYAVNNNKIALYETLEFIQRHHLNLFNDLIASDNEYYLLGKKAIEVLLEELYKFTESILFLKESTPKSLAKIVSFGELLSTTIFHYFLNSKQINNVWLDVRSLLKTDSNFQSAKVNFEGSSKLIQKIYNKDLIQGSKLAITQGFIGADELGNTTTLGRGGSDYSAAIFGKLFNSNEVQIWTDVDGILTADPREVEDVRTIPVMEFDEVRTLAYLGAKVLHPQTLIPAVESSIPVKVLNSMNATQQGTLIVNRIIEEKPVLHSVVRTDAVKIIFPLTQYDNFVHKALEILSIFEKSKTTIFFVSILPDALTIWFAHSCNILNDLDKLFHSTFFDLNLSLSLITLVGINLEKLAIKKFFEEMEITSYSVVSNSSSNNIILSSSRNKAKELMKIANELVIKYL